MRVPKARKPRTTGVNLNFDGSHMFGQPWIKYTPAVNKLLDRNQAGLCLGCGKAPCKCKSKMFT